MSEHEQMKFQLPLRVSVEVSTRLNTFILAIHCLSIVPVVIADLAAKTVFLIILILFANYTWLYGYCLRHWYQLILQSDGRWLLSTDDSDFTAAKLLPGSLVHPLLTVLRFRQSTYTRTVILTKDNVNPDQFRRLRVFLLLPPAE